MSPGVGSRGRKTRRKSTRRAWALIILAVLAISVSGVLIYMSDTSRQGSTTTQLPASSTTTSSQSSGKPVILYINQGNGAVNESNFGAMLAFASAQGFNTIFFQVYREGTTLFTTQQLSYFVAQAHGEGMRIFFSLYITNSTQAIPAEIYPLGEDGISLDMSTLSVSSQTLLFGELRQGYTSGETAITTTDFSLPLSPDLLVLETYGIQYQRYIHPGVVGSVGVFATTSRSDYEEQFQYALDNSDGVMVFDYAGLMKSGY